MKHGPVTKLDMRKKITSKKKKKKNNYVMLENCDIIDFFPIYSESGGNLKTDSSCIVCKTYIFFNSNLLFYKNCKQN